METSTQDESSPSGTTQNDPLSAGLEKEHTTASTAAPSVRKTHAGLPEPIPFTGPQTLASQSMGLDLPSPVPAQEDSSPDSLEVVVDLPLPATRAKSGSVRDNGGRKQTSADQECPTWGASINSPLWGNLEIGAPITTVATKQERRRLSPQMVVITTQKRPWLKPLPHRLQALMKPRSSAETFPLPSKMQVLMEQHNYATAPFMDPELPHVSTRDLMRDSGMPDLMHRSSSPKQEKAPSASEELKEEPRSPDSSEASAEEPPTLLPFNGPLPERTIEWRLIEAQVKMMQLQKKLLKNQTKVRQVRQEHNQQRKRYHALYLQARGMAPPEESDSFLDTRDTARILGGLNSPSKKQNRRALGGSQKLRVSKL